MTIFHLIEMMITPSHMSYHMNAYEILRVTVRLAEISKDGQYNIHHVETSVASHHKQFKRPIASKLLAASVQGLL